MSYSNPNRQKYEWWFDAGNNGNETWSFRGPKGKSGRLIDYGIEGVTEALTAAAELSVGTAADPDAYGEEYAFGVVAVDTVESIRSLYRPGIDAGFATYMVNPEIPADTLVQVSLTDDTSAGMGLFFCIIDWAD